MRTAMELREVARFRREKARRCADAAASMGLPEDRARLIGYAKFLEEEARASLDVMEFAEYARAIGGDPVRFLRQAL